ncbi:oxidoreductase [Blastomyces silverae]|uniref:Oxidoreductase n=1 Tax=Blastomyces silverae TaxID=2060906 RepID=A0A0H1BCN4_9EURO|nr:oxidoreductase [Blastomyces silverae]
MGTIGISEAEKEMFVQIGVKSTPVGRISNAEEVARAAVFIGFEATFSTGTEFLADGGLRTLQKE